MCNQTESCVSLEELAKALLALLPVPFQQRAKKGNSIFTIISVSILQVGIAPDRPLPGPLPANGDDFCRLISDSSSDGHIDVKDLFAKSS